jgi:hypothetical protein
MLILSLILTVWRKLYLRSFLFWPESSRVESSRLRTRSSRVESSRVFLKYVSSRAESSKAKTESSRVESDFFWLVSVSALFYFTQKIPSNMNLRGNSTSNTCNLVRTEVYNTKAYFIIGINIFYCLWASDFRRVETYAARLF